MNLPELILYTRVGCHLCEDMLAQLQVLRGELHFCLQVRDVDATPGLADKYGLKVPVLCDGDREICQYFLDMRALERYLSGR